jgi:hypothetical protein
VGRQLAVGSWQLAVGSWQLAVGGRRQERIQTGKGKWQNSNGLQFAIFKIANPLPFDLCHLSFEMPF